MQIKQNGVAVLQFSATWCMPCKTISPILESLKPQFTDVEFYKVDSDANKELFAEYKVTAVPTLIFLKDGAEQKRMIGLQNKSTIATCLKSLS